MNKLHKYINSNDTDINIRKYYPIGIKYYPKYIIRTYIKKYPTNYFEIGFIYQFYYNDYELMHNYYNKAIDEGNSKAMNNLGYYYEHIEKNYELMKKYYLDAIKLGNTYAMDSLGHYYDCENNYTEMKYYYMSAIKLNYKICMNNILDYYKKKLIFIMHNITSM